MRRLILSVWGVIALLVVLAIATWPWRYTNEDVWPNLSSNLFASVVTTALTVFGVERILAGIEAQKVQRRQVAARDETARSIIWILNRLHGHGPSLVAGLPFTDDFHDQYATWVEGHQSDLRDRCWKAPWAEIYASLGEIQERLPHLRTTLALSIDALPSDGMAHLIRALGLVEAMTAYGLKPDSDQPERALSTMAVRTLLADALYEFVRAYRVIGPWVPNRRALEDEGRRGRRDQQTMSFIMFGPGEANQQATQEFIKRIGPEAAKKRFIITGTSLVLASVVLVGWGLVGGHLPQAINAAALISDIGGAILLVTGLLMPQEMLGAMGANPVGGNDATYEYWLATRKDARCALGLLVLGFAGQIVADIISGPR